MLETLRLTNFLGHHATELDLRRPLTVLVGANGAGKSSVLRALQLLGGVAGGSPAELEGFARVGANEIRVRDPRTRACRATGTGWRRSSPACGSRIPIGSRRSSATCGSSCPACGACASVASTTRSSASTASAAPFAADYVAAVRSEILPLFGGSTA